MSTSTTNKRNRKRVAAIALVGLGVVGLGAASASQLNVTGKDAVAAGITTTLTGCTGDVSAKVTAAVPAVGATWSAAGTLAYNQVTFTVANASNCTGTATVQVLDNTKKVLSQGAVAVAGNGTYTATLTGTATTATIDQVAVVIAQA